MPNQLKTSLDVVQPNKTLDAYRLEILGALKEAKRGNAGVDDNYWLVDLAFSLLDGALNDLGAANTELAGLRTDLTALTERVAALESPTEPPAPVA